MKKVISIGFVIFILVFIFFFTRYHLNLDGAWAELEEEWEGEVIAPNSKEDNTAILIDKDGSIFLGFSIHTDIVIFYHDFTIYPTKLNVYNLPNQDECYFSKVKGYGANYEMYFILVSNPDVDKISFGSYDKRLIPLEEYVKSNELKKQLKNIKLLYKTVGIPEGSIEPLGFVDKEDNIINLNSVDKDSSTN